ncbi:MAG TPA: Hsp20/alpha crystallin family protein [Spirochaetota bacterium]|nr:Hsp20/alpha crystallin family protein [Spirochaetota bacterium]HPC42076.1 Hsp20/alpha crystallin family protein [Spirochaetota bacterium]HPL18497.1 Hsp20/alpha crystallin family protein [Spirochaetota bacterium]HQF09030.1 Hsp20/alpha crystallin family protein [Spirochaetota bacterium]HQH97918.1 Hsp20/alpha crystallin family protein [Spirochaetota bacterium]
MYTYDIFDDIFNLRDTVNNFFNDYTGRWRGREFPNMEIYEGKDDLEIRALVPGIKAADLNIHLVDNNLIIEGEKKNDYADNPYIRRERQFGSFKKSFTLPYKVNADAISADLINGILHIRLQKSEDAKPKKIEIK